MNRLNEAENKLLIIVDPQNDFCDEGSLPVPGANAGIDALANYLNNGGAKEYKAIVVTKDWHPSNHCSFDTNGGPWPVHCVQNTSGAEIYGNLAKVICDKEFEPTIVELTKGTHSDREEYSIFANDESSATLKELIKNNKIDRIDFVGLAGDVCVLNTLRDAIAIYGSSIAYYPITKFAPSLDGGKALDEFIKTSKIGEYYEQ